MCPVGNRKKRLWKADNNNSSYFQTWISIPPCLPPIFSLFASNFLLFPSFFPPFSLQFLQFLSPLAASVSSFFPQRKFKPNQLLNTYLLWIFFCPFFLFGLPVQVLFKIHTPWIIFAQIIYLTILCFKRWFVWGHMEWPSISILYVVKSPANVYDIYDTVYETSKRQYDECVCCRLGAVSVLFMQQACKQQARYQPLPQLHQLPHHLRHHPYWDPHANCDPDPDNCDPVSFSSSKHAIYLFLYHLLFLVVILTFMIQWPLTIQTYFPNSEVCIGKALCTDYMRRKEFIDPGFILTVWWPDCTRFICWSMTAALWLPGHHSGEVLLAWGWIYLFNRFLRFVWSN